MKQNIADSKNLSRMVTFRFFFCNVIFFYGIIIHVWQNRIVFFFFIRILFDQSNNVLFLIIFIDAKDLYLIYLTKKCGCF